MPTWEKVSTDWMTLYCTTCSTVCADRLRMWQESLDITISQLGNCMSRYGCAPDGYIPDTIMCAIENMEKVVGVLKARLKTLIPTDGTLYTIGTGPMLQAKVVAPPVTPVVTVSFVPLSPTELTSRPVHEVNPIDED